MVPSKKRELGPTGQLPNWRDTLIAITQILHEAPTLMAAYRMDGIEWETTSKPPFGGIEKYLFMLNLLRDPEEMYKWMKIVEGVNFGRHIVDSVFTESNEDGIVYPQDWSLQFNTLKEKGEVLGLDWSSINQGIIMRCDELGIDLH